MDEDFVTLDGIDKAKLKSLSQRSDRKGLIRMAGHLAALFGTGCLVFLADRSNGLWILPAFLLHGVVLIFLFAPLHETIHRTAFKNRRLNDAVAWLCGTLLALPRDYFRAFHFAHHRHTQDPTRDPELSSPKPASLDAYLLTLTGWHYWTRSLQSIASHAAGRVTEDFIPARQHATIVREARILLVIYGTVLVLSLIAGSSLALVYWVIPVLLGQPALRAYLLAEHTGLPMVPDMLRNTRTTISNALVRWLAWNMPYHTEHHAYPAVPFHALPQAHAVLRPHLKALDSGYLAVHQGLVADLLRPLDEPTME